MLLLTGAFNKKSQRLYKFIGSFKPKIGFVVILNLILYNKPCMRDLMIKLQLNICRERIAKASSSSNRNKDFEMLFEKALRPYSNGFENNGRVLLIV